MKHAMECAIAAGVLAICVILFINSPKSQGSANDAADSVSDALINSQTGNIQDSVNNAVNDAILGDDVVVDTNTGEKAPSIGDAIKDTLNDINADNYDNKEVKIIKVESSNKLVIEKDGKELKIRLIGVHATGSSSGLTALVEAATDLRIETDTKKKEGEYTLAYLWNGEPMENGSNMINIQMIKNEYAYSTYDFVHPGVIETPNIKYQTLFIDAIKNT